MRDAICRFGGREKIRRNYVCFPEVTLEVTKPQRTPPKLRHGNSSKKWDKGPHVEEYSGENAADRVTQLLGSVGWLHIIGETEARTGKKRKSDWEGEKTPMVRLLAP